MIYIDGHVHLWRSYGIADFFDCAFTNFRQRIERSGENCRTLLFLADTGETQAYSGLKNRAEQRRGIPARNGEVALMLESGGDSLRVSQGDHARPLWLVPARQITTAEGLEVLGLFLEEPVDDGNTCNSTLEKINAENGVPVLPWGVGKWLGRRGRLIQQLLAFQVRNGRPILLGDNANRPWFWPGRGIYALAKKYGLQVLSGSDPLNLPNGMKNVGAYGTVMDLQSEAWDGSAGTIKNSLLNGTARLAPFGEQSTVRDFFQDQTALRLKKMRRPGGGESR